LWQLALIDSFLLPEGPTTRLLGLHRGASLLAHIYIGTIGMEGAFETMAEGTVDLNWAKEHHGLWFEEEMARSAADESHGQASTTPAE
jgi:formate dehydrogenase subunit gamma